MESFQRKFLLLSQRLGAIILPTLFLFLALAQNLIGQNWMKITPSFANGDTLLARANLIFVTKNVGWIIPSGSTNHPPTEFATKIFTTTDGGNHWELQKESREFFSLTSIFALDSLHFWILGEGGDIILTIDGGVLWDTTRIVNVWTGSGFALLYFFDEWEGIAFNAYRWFTTDGGKNWTRGDSSGVFSVLPVDAYFANRNIGWIVGVGNPSGATHSGFIAKTFDGGRTWKYQGDTTGLTIPWLSGLAFLDTLSGFAIGNNWNFSSGYIFSTNDGGEDWKWKQIIGSGGFYDIGFFDQNLGWITGDAGKIWRTTDGGVTWTLQNTGVNARLGKLIILRAEKTAYVLGDNHYQLPYTLLRADLSTAIDEHRAFLPQEFSLLQNYPNPFNSETIIEYRIEKTSPVELKIFDLCGKEAKAFTGRTQTPGRYKIVWDGTTNEGLVVSSGVYLCRLTAGNGMAYRKMLFLE